MNCMMEVLSIIREPKNHVRRGKGVWTRKVRGINRLWAYISEKNIKALRTKGYEYILMMKQNQRICKEIIEEYGCGPCSH